NEQGPLGISLDVLQCLRAVDLQQSLYATAQDLRPRLDRAQGIAQLVRQEVSQTAVARIRRLPGCIVRDRMLGRRSLVRALLAEDNYEAIGRLAVVRGEGQGGNGIRGVVVLE